MITVNGEHITDEAIAAEARFHGGATSQRAAACALAARVLLLQRARALGIDATDEEQAIETLLAREAPVPEPTEDECRRYYDGHPADFRRGELVEAAHILFAVTPNAAIEAIRRQAESVLKQVVAAPDRFADFAQRFSNCPSAAQGGTLGQLGRGDAVPEFERALFENEASGVLPRLVCTRYGFHIVYVARRVPGDAVDFATARPQIEQRLLARVQTKAAEQYVRILASRAAVSGVDLGAADSPLVQ